MFHCCNMMSCAQDQLSCHMGQIVWSLLGDSRKSRLFVDPGAAFRLSKVMPKTACAFDTPGPPCCVYLLGHDTQRHKRLLLFSQTHQHVHSGKKAQARCRFTAAAMEGYLDARARKCAPRLIGRPDIINNHRPHIQQGSRSAGLEVQHDVAVSQIRKTPSKPTSDTGTLLSLSHEQSIWLVSTKTSTSADH